MQSFDTRSVTRRRLLQHIAGLGLGRSLAPLTVQLGAVAAALTATQSAAAVNDYKALVCVYLDGGLDHLDALVPYDTTNYNRLASFRAGMMAPRDALLTLNGATQGGMSVAMNPELPRLRALYNSGRLAVVTGVGSLLQPTTKAGLRSGQAYPPGAGSHNDGNAMFHTLGIEGTQYGWGGKVLDLFESANSGSLFTSLSIGRYNAFGSGLKTQQFQSNELAQAENIALLGGTSVFTSPQGPAALLAVLRQGTGNLLEDAVLGTAQRVMDGSTQLAAAFAASSVPDVFVRDGTDIGRYYGDNSLGKQLRTVARAIQQRGMLGSPKRQIFFCDFGGFDTHGGTPTDRLRFVDRALDWFHGEMVRQGLANQVTLFTTTEFGRTLKSNGDGTDHGWGGVTWVLGGAVKGGSLYGSLVDTDPKSAAWIGHAGSDDANVFQIPTLSTEQYGATLASWFGVSATDIATIFPNLNRFSPANLGFL
jgi:uncharacterized protein (DUF1501 family)